MRKMIPLSLLLLCLLLSGTAGAEEQAQGMEAPEEISDMTDADDWFSTTDETADIESENDRERLLREQKEHSRYVHVLTDNGYEYDLDTRNTRWIPLPHSGDEYIIDTWVKLVKDASEDTSDGNYSYPAKYYLAHYYVRPKTRQIQFLSELEVTGGRPDNTVKGRGYQAQNWEDLTPDSIEDAIYASAVKHAGKNRIGSAFRIHMSVRDAVEEYLRVSF